MKNEDLTREEFIGRYLSFLGGVLVGGSAPSTKEVHSSLPELVATGALTMNDLIKVLLRVASIFRVHFLELHGYVVVQSVYVSQVGPSL